MQEKLCGKYSFLNEFEDFQARIPTGVEMTYPTLTTMQVNVGRLCNLTCKHCHVACGPAFEEQVMSRENMQHVLNLVDHYGFRVLDITGGAPEMNPHFRWFLKEAQQHKDLRVLVRSNLTLFEEDEYQDLPELFAEYGVVVIASLPHYTEKTTNRQRGDGVFDKVIRALKRLNALGYGQQGSGLELDLVYNPNGAFLPGPQSVLEQEYKKQLGENYQIDFNQLFVIANNPSGRFGQWLDASDNVEMYMESLMGAFNPVAAEHVMCRDQLSVMWDGRLFDCDFNQAVDLPLTGISTIAALDEARPETLQREILFANHCYGCTAGAGSSCGGEIA